MTVRDRLTAMSALAVLLAASSLEPVFTTLIWFPRTLGAVLVVALVAAALRRSRLARPLQPLVTSAALLAYLVLAFVASSLHHVVLPGGATVAALRGLVTAAGTDLAQYGPPAPATAPLVLLVVGGVGLVALAVDTIAALGGRPAAAGLPLLALFAVPSAVLPGGLGWLPFVLGAGGWLALLLVQGRDEAVRWGTALRASSRSDPAGLGRIGRRIGGAALGVAVLVPALVPGLDGRLFAGGDGGGSIGGSRSVTTYNPITRLRGELTLPVPVEILRYTTDDPEPDYLRMTTLGIYDGGGWRQEVLRGNLRDNGVDDPIPGPVGRSTAARTRAVQATVSIRSLDAFWLPVPATPSTVNINGPWMWDRNSESIFAIRSNTAKAGTYTVRSSRLLPDPALLADGKQTLPPQVAPYDTSVEATPAVRALTLRIVAGQSTDYGRAAALQAFFRNPVNSFVYAQETATGGSPDALEDFLRARRGFCEQYASAMGAMLRIAGVPSRVAVGFTPGMRQLDGSWVVTTSEAHAWPEAWFEGAGWVRFEPTPSRGGISPPAYGAAAPTGPQAPGVAPGAAAAPTPTDGLAETPEERRLRESAERVTRAAGALQSGGRGAASRRLAVLGGSSALVLLVLAAPALLHLTRRRRRWRSPTAATAWAQLRDDATDTGHDWRDAESPRATGSRLVAETHLSGEAADAVRRLTNAVERERYARPAPVAVPAGPGAVSPDNAAVRAAGLLADSAAVRRALRAGAPGRLRLRAVLLPPSTLRRASSWTGSRVADLLDALDGLPAAVTGRLRRGSA